MFLNKLRTTLVRSHSKLKKNNLCVHFMNSKFKMSVMHSNSHVKFRYGIVLLNQYNNVCKRPQLLIQNFLLNFSVHCRQLLSYILKGFICNGLWWSIIRNTPCKISSFSRSQSWTEKYSKACMQLKCKWIQKHLVDCERVEGKPEHNLFFFLFLGFWRHEGLSLYNFL